MREELHATQDSQKTKQSVLESHIGLGFLTLPLVHPHDQLSCQLDPEPAFETYFKFGTMTGFHLGVVKPVSGSGSVECAFGDVNEASI